MGRCTGFWGLLLLMLVVGGCQSQPSSVVPSAADSPGDPAGAPLLVQSATGGALVPVAGESERYTLTLEGVPPTTVYLSGALAGHLATATLVADWATEAGGERHAALELLGGERTGDVLLLALGAPSYDAGTQQLSYPATPLPSSDQLPILFTIRRDPAASVPTSFGAASLFLADPNGQGAAAEAKKELAEWPTESLAGTAFITTGRITERVRTTYYRVTLDGSGHVVTASRAATLLDLVQVGDAVDVEIDTDDQNYGLILRKR